ncbi:MAG TPA: lamin tail domain-containing protein [Verrucomicrobiales bacterium]|nr:lamin tail domain-containing protein [Verrucomicrobiales bacterium]
MLFSTVHARLRMAYARAFLGMVLVIPTALPAQVVLNEVLASSSDYLTREDANGVLRLGTGPHWMDADFDDSGWREAADPVGAGAPGLATDLGSGLRGSTPSLYLRVRFQASAEQAASEEPLRMQAWFNDGFVAYVNGQEVARANLGAPGDYIHREEFAFNLRNESSSESLASPQAAREYLLEGENVLAVQVHNYDISSTIFFKGRLFIGLGLFQGGSSIPLVVDGMTWRLFTGLAEPSGGIYDPELLGSPGYKGAFSDWIELRNPGPAAVDLTGWSLSDDPDDPEAFVFPAGTTIVADGYLLVLADGWEGAAPEGKYLHASFRLSADGEFLGLYRPGGVPEDLWAPGFPPQRPFVSYGRDPNGLGYFVEPTPGRENAGTAAAGFVERPRFSHGPGFYDEGFSLSMEAGGAGTSIRYTLDGTEPTGTHGILYEAPVRIELIDADTGTVARARAFREGWLPSRIETATYLVGQHEALRTLPAVSLSGDPGGAFYKPYGVLAIDGGSYVDGQWRGAKITDYNIPMQRGRAYERPVSLEILDPFAPQTALRVDGGLRFSASNWSRPRMTFRQPERSPWQVSATEKPSLNFYLREEYGEEEIRRQLFPDVAAAVFDTLRLRAGKNDISNPFIRDELMRRLAIDMGQVSVAGIQNTLYVNGELKGYYNLTPRLRESFFQQVYGSSAPWDVMLHDGIADGDDAAYRSMLEALRKDLSVPENYEEALRWVDPVNVADYLILNIYGATWDWPHNNFALARERSPEGRWRMYVWDAEGAFGHGGSKPVNYDVITSDLRGGAADIPRIYQGLAQNVDFRQLFADRIQRHFFNGGALMEENLRRRMEELRDEINPVMQYVLRQTMSEADFNRWFTERERYLFSPGKQFENARLWTSMQAPVFDRNGGLVSEGAEVTMRIGSLFNPQPGAIYYTVDGSDPRLPGGELSGDALSYAETSPVIISQTTEIRARQYHATIFGSRNWSPLAEAVFRVGSVPAGRDNLVVSEILYRPGDTDSSEAAMGYSRSDFEFVELRSVGPDPVDLLGVAFTAGIDFVFQQSLALEPGAYLVLGTNEAALRERYGGQFQWGGAYGGRLSNEGESLELRDAAGDLIARFDYSPAAPWPEIAATEGHSLILANTDSTPASYDVGAWAASAEPGGTPGRGEDSPEDSFAVWAAHYFDETEVDPAQRGPDGDPDNDGRINAIEFALGMHPLRPDDAALPNLEPVDGNGSRRAIRLRRFAGRAGVVLTVESSVDLQDWEEFAWEELEHLESGDEDENGYVEELRSLPEGGGPQRYVRIRVKME